MYMHKIIHSVLELIVPQIELIGYRKADKIELEKYNEQKILTKEKVMAYLTNAILKKPKTLIHTLIQKIIVYEDKVEIYYNYTDETNPGDDSPRDLSYWLGSDSSVMVDRNHTNSNLTFRFSEKWFCTVVDLPEKL